MAKKTKKNLETQLKKLGIDLDLGIERIAKEKIDIKRITSNYHLVDPSFLSTTHPTAIHEGTYTINRTNPRRVFSLFGGRFSGGLLGVEYEVDRSKEKPNFTLKLPKFAIYSLDSPICRFDLTLGYRESKDYNGLHVLELDSELPKILARSLIKSLDLGGGVCYTQNLNPHVYNCDTVFGDPYEAAESTEADDLEFTAMFEGVLPKRVKNKIKTAKKLFGKEIYIVTEADNWEGKSIPIQDPLVIGVKQDKCYLLDKFNCVALKELVELV